MCSFGEGKHAGRHRFLQRVQELVAGKGLAHVAVEADLFQKVGLIAGDAEGGQGHGGRLPVFAVGSYRVQHVDARFWAGQLDIQQQRVVGGVL